MNEKIKLLAERAGMKPQDDMTKFGMGEDMNSYNCQGFMLEKFAELIVREAMLVCRTEWVSDSSAQKYGNQCADSIKQHFGVEE
jgi:hypothetical protein